MPAKKESPCANCINGKKPPIAVAGADQVINLIDSIALDGSASSDPDGSIIQWSWTKISGPGFLIIETPSSVKPKIKNLIVGT